jgi:hypothetical protein
MSKMLLSGLALFVIFFLGNGSGNYVAGFATARQAQAQSKQNTSESQSVRHTLDEAGTGRLEKLIVESASVTMEINLNRLNGVISATEALTRLDFTAALNSFFPILIFNDVLRGPEAGSIALLAATRVNGPGYRLPVRLSAALNHLVVETLPSETASNLVVRDGKTGFTFFNIEGYQYDYDAKARLLTITNGRLLISKEFANGLGRSLDTGVAVGKISVTAMMQPIEVQILVNGEPQSVVMPPLRHALGAESPLLVAGPDVIVGDLPEMAQYGINGSFVGLGIGTTACNNGDQALDWFALPNTDHPVIPQNFYRMSGGTSNNERLEQIGQSWLKHVIVSSKGDACGFGCTPGCTGSQLCPVALIRTALL